MTTGQAGWNGTDPELPDGLPGNWTAAALNPGGAFTGRAGLPRRSTTAPMPSTRAQGFDFDEVTITNFYQQVPDRTATTAR